MGLKGWLSGPKSKDAKAESGRSPAGPLDTRRIAVLPFASMSADPNDSYFADGVTEEIISTLSGISGLRVISRTSVMGYKGTTKKVGEIGRELEAGSVLEGSFRKAGNKIRVTAQLVTVTGDEHVWAESYDKQLDDVFAVQTDIAKQVAEALRVKILKPEMSRLDKRPTLSAKAYTSYLRGRQCWNTRTLEGVRRAIEYFEEAVKEDTNFALGYVGLADCHQILASNWAIDKDINHERAEMFLAKALELEPDLAEAHATKGLILMNGVRLHEAEQELVRAIELKPSYASAHHWLYMVLEAGPRTDEAFKEIEKAMELDPVSPVINENLSFYYYARRDYQKALEIAKRTVELSPGRTIPHIKLAMCFRKLGLLGDARREMGIVVKLDRASHPDVEKIVEVYLGWFEGNEQSVEKLLPAFERHAGGPWPNMQAWEVASFFFWLGENERGFEWLKRSSSIKEMAWGARFDDRFDNVRADPKFVDFFRRFES